MEELDHELLISCSAGLGSWLEDKAGNPVYCKTDDCIECLKDLQRFLRRDDPDKRPAFFTLSKSNITKTDLVPLLSAYPGDKEVVFNAVKMATFLTMPIDETSEAVHAQVDALQQVKEAFLKQEALAIVVALVAEPLSKSSRMSEMDVQLVQLVITFVRNLLCIPDRTSTAGSRGDHKSRLGSYLVMCLFDQHVMELLLLMALHTAQGQLRSEAALLLEVFSRIFQDVDAIALLSAKLPKGGATQESSRALKSKSNIIEVQSLFAKEKQSLAAMRGPPRHPRYGGTFVSYNQQKPSSVSVMRNAPKRTPLPALAAQKPKTRLIAGEDVKIGGHWSVMIKLRNYLEQLLEGSYDLLMTTVRRLLHPGLGVSRLARSDFSRFISLAKLCTAYTRQKQENLIREKRKDKENAKDAGVDPDEMEETSPFATIAATMGWDTFHLVHSLWLSIVDLPNKSPEKDWGLQHNSLSLFKEMLLTLDLAQKIGSPSDKIAADKLSRRLLHDDQKDSGLLPVLSRMLKNFSFRYQPRSHAAEIVEALHITLRLLEQLSRREAGAFMVKRRAAMRRRRAERPSKKRRSEPPEQPTSDQEDDRSHGEPQEMSGQAESDGAEEGAQKEKAELSSQGHSEKGGSPGDDVGSGHEAVSGRSSPRDPFEEMEEEEEESERRTKEVVYDLNQRVRQELAFPSVVHIYAWLLYGFKTNNVFLNHSIVSFLKRIASPEALNLTPMLYQLSIMRLFCQVLSDTAFRTQPHSRELVHFCTEITQGLFARLLPKQLRHKEAERNGQEPDSTEAESGRQAVPEVDEKEAKVQHNLSSMMFIELLFWKNQREAEDVRDEYNWRHIYGSREHEDDPNGAQSPKRGQSTISTEQEAQLKELFEKHGMEKGYLDTVVSHVGAGLSKNRVAQQLKKLGLKRGVLTQTQESELRKLYAQHKKERGYLQSIADKMPGSFRKSQIATHLRKLGLKLQGRKPSAFSSDSEKAESDAADSQGSEREDAFGSEQEQGDADPNRRPAPALKRQPMKKKRARKLADWSDDDSAGEEQDPGPALVSNAAAKEHTQNDAISDDIDPDLLRDPGEDESIDDSPKRAPRRHGDSADSDSDTSENASEKNFGLEVQDIEREKSREDTVVSGSPDRAQVQQPRRLVKKSTETESG